MSSIYAVSLGGIQRAGRVVEASAYNVARSSVEGAKAVRVVEGGAIEETDKPIDLVGDTVELAGARMQLRASVKVLETQSETEKALLDIVV